MTLSELVALGEALRQLEQPKAEARRREGNARGGSAAPGQVAARASGDLADEPPRPRRNWKSETDGVVADALGISRPAYKRARRVVQFAEDSAQPEAVRQAALSGPIRGRDRAGRRFTKLDVWSVLAGHAVAVPVQLGAISRIASVQGCGACGASLGAVRVVGAGRLCRCRLLLLWRLLLRRVLLGWVDVRRLVLRWLCDRRCRRLGGPLHRSGGRGRRGRGRRQEPCGRCGRDCRCRCCRCRHRSRHRCCWACRLDGRDLGLLVRVWQRQAEDQEEQEQSADDGCRDLSYAPPVPLRLWLWLWWPRTPVGHLQPPCW